MVWSYLLQFHFSSKLDRGVTNLFGVGAWLEFFRGRKVNFNVRRVAKREGLQSPQPHESSLVSPNFCLCSSISLTPRPGPPKLGSSRKLLSQRNVRFESPNPCSNGNPWIWQCSVSQPSRKNTKGRCQGHQCSVTMAAAAIRHIQYCKKTWISRSVRARHGDFLHLLGRLGLTMNCTYPRDRVYAYLSL